MKNKKNRDYYAIARSEMLDYLPEGSSACLDVGCARSQAGDPRTGKADFGSRGKLYHAVLSVVGLAERLNAGE